MKLHNLYIYLYAQKAVNRKLHRQKKYIHLTVSLLSTGCSRCRGARGVGPAYPRRNWSCEPGIWSTTWPVSRVPPVARRSTRATISARGTASFTAGTCANASASSVSFSTTWRTAIEATAAGLDKNFAGSVINRRVIIIFVEIVFRGRPSVYRERLCILYEACFKWPCERVVSGSMLGKYCREGNN